jgi:hypothetical protein
MRAEPLVSTPSHGDLQDAIRYWESRRIGYNLALFAAASSWVLATWPHFRPAFALGTIAPLTVLAALANVCYCAAYAVEALAQGSGLGAPWRRWRWSLWVAGTLLALLFENYWIADEIYPYVR